MYRTHYSSEDYDYLEMQEIILDILDNVGKPITKKQLNRELRHVVDASLAWLINSSTPKIVRSRKKRGVFLSLQK